MAKDEDQDKGKRSWRSPRRMTREEREREERVFGIVQEHGPASTDDVARELQRQEGTPGGAQRARSILRRLAGFDRVKDITGGSDDPQTSSWWVVHLPEKRTEPIQDPVHHEPTGGTGRREPKGSRAQRRPPGTGVTRPAAAQNEQMEPRGRKENYYDRLQREREERERAQREQRQGKGGGGGGRKGGGSGVVNPASSPHPAPPAQNRGGGSGVSKPASAPTPPPDDDNGGKDTGGGIFKPQW